MSCGRSHDYVARASRWLAAVNTWMGHTVNSVNPLYPVVIQCWVCGFYRYYPLLLLWIFPLLPPSLSCAGLYKHARWQSLERDIFKFRL
jgi:hypothetical protein